MKNKNKVILILSLIIIIGLISYFFLLGNKIKITSITLEEKTTWLFVGDNKKLDIAILPENFNGDEVIWESSDSLVATVDNGVITGINEGNAIITATAKSNNNVYDSCMVKVIKKEATDLSFKDSDVEVRVNNSKDIEVSIEPIELKELVTWVSSNEKIAKVDANGKVTGISQGKTQIKATYGNKEAVTNVRVILPISKLSMEKSSTTIYVSKEEQLNLIIIPEENNNQEAKWTSSNTSVATVENGLVKGISEGNAIITATLDGLSVTCEVKVNIPAEEIKLNKTKLNLKKDNSEKLIATVSPSNTTDKTITWTSSNDKIIKVDANGKVMALRAGKATITATINGKKATCEVTSIGYVITEDSKFTGTVKAEYNSSTLKYRILRTDSDYVLVWVMDAYKQWNSALPNLGKAYKAEDILSIEINKYGYQNKGLVATNGGFFWDGWKDTPCSPFILNKGRIIRDVENIDYIHRAYDVAGITSDSILKMYYFSSNDYSKNMKTRQEMLDDGVRNSFTVGAAISATGKLETGMGNVNHTVLCQVDENNFVIYSGSRPFTQITKTLRNTYNCRMAVNFDGGGSRKLYYKNGPSQVKRIFGGNRKIPDMMYFIEQ